MLYGEEKKKKTITTAIGERAKVQLAEIDFCL